MRTYGIEVPGKSVFEWIVLAGLVGGLAEMLWVMLWAAAGPLEGLHVASQIASSVFRGMTEGTTAAATGLAIHFALSLLVAAVFAQLLWRPLQARWGEAGVLRGAVATLLGVWAVNFLVVLPALNPAFVELMPLPATLVSKALFGVTMGAVLSRAPAA